jgi:transposase
MGPKQIAAAVGMHFNTVYQVLRTFDREGMPSVGKVPSPGAPTRVAPEQAAEIARLAETPPGELGLEYGRWSLSTLQAYLLKQRVVRKISREHLRRLLKKRGSTFAASGES